MKQHNLILALLVALVHTVAAQTPPADNPSTSLPLLLKAVPDADLLAVQHQHLYLDLDATAFFYDTERFMPFEKGTTTVGTHFAPALVYGINPRAQLRVGFDATLIAGLDSIHTLRPLLSLVYAPTRWLTLVGGSLFGTHNHQVGDPALDPLRALLHHAENGFQILTHTPRWQSDSWLDWTHYLTPYTYDQEYFTLGTRHRLHLLSLNADMPDLSLDGHFMALHRGGEAKTIDTNMVTHLNERIALQLALPLSQALQLHLAMPALFSQQVCADGIIEPGYAFMPSAGLRLLLPNDGLAPLLRLYANAGFYYGHNYYCKYGAPLFWSLNDYTRPFLHTAADATADPRRMPFLCLSAEHRFANLAVGLQFDAYHDLTLHKSDFLFAFYMRYDGLVRLR